jgi:Holliday junction resolvase-like predicted endonuclease
LKSLTLLVRVKGMKKIDDKKIKGISIELDRSTKLNELDDTINDFKKKTDNKHEIDVRIDIMNSTLHMKRVKKPYITLATKDGEVVKKNDEIDIKIKK